MDALLIHKELRSAKCRPDCSNSGSGKDVPDRVYTIMCTVIKQSQTEFSHWVIRRLRTLSISVTDGEKSNSSIATCHALSLLPILALTHVMSDMGLCQRPSVRKKLLRDHQDTVYAYKVSASPAS